MSVLTYTYTNTTNYVAFAQVGDALLFIFIGVIVLLAALYSLYFFKEAFKPFMGWH